jgi:hypothetical protein
MRFVSFLRHSIEQPIKKSKNKKRLKDEAQEAFDLTSITVGIRGVRANAFEARTGTAAPEHPRHGSGGDNGHVAQKLLQFSALLTVLLQGHVVLASAVATEERGTRAAVEMASETIWRNGAVCVENKWAAPVYGVCRARNVTKDVCAATRGRSADLNVARQAATCYLRANGLLQAMATGDPREHHAGAVDRT